MVVFRVALVEKGRAQDLGFRDQGRIAVVGLFNFCYFGVWACAV